MLEVPNIEGKNSEFEYVIRSLKIQPSFNIPNYITSVNHLINSVLLCIYWKHFWLVGQWVKASKSSQWSFI